MPYKVIIAFINVGSNYWSLFKYAKYFARRRPKLTEDHKAVGLVLKLEESAQSQAAGATGLGRSMTVRSVGVRTSSRGSSRMGSVYGAGPSRARWSFQSDIEEGSEYDVIEHYT